MHVGASAKDPNGISVEMQFLHNTKVTGSAIAEKNLDVQRDQNKPKGWSIALMETISHVLGYDQVFADIDFIHILTVPLEERPGTEKMPMFNLRSNN